MLAVETTKRGDEILLITSTANTLGAIGGISGFSGTLVINAKASTNIQGATNGYASNPASNAQFSAHWKVIYIGN